MGSSYQKTRYFENCTNTANGDINFAMGKDGFMRGIAGILGYSWNSDGTSGSYTTFKNCHNAGDITHTDDYGSNVMMGGIVGRVENPGNNDSNKNDNAAEGKCLYLENCSNSGKITAKGKSGSSGAGGLVGTVKSGGNKYYTVVIKNSSNSGTIIGNYNSGGLYGNSTGNNGHRVVIIDSQNTGAVTSSKAYAGGIAGGSDMSETTFEISGCTNGAKITGKTASGGILGCAAGNVTVTECTNNGVIDANGYGGGILGYTKKTVNATTCTNNGAVNGIGEDSARGLGGIVGESDGAATLESCVNNAAITASVNKYHVGGIAGRIDGALIVKNSINTKNGTVSVYINASDMIGVGGIIGYASARSQTYENCINHANVTLSGGNGTQSLFGGIVGRSYMNQMTMTGCINYGNIDTSIAPNAGGGTGGLIGFYQADNSGGTTLYVLNITNCVNHTPGNIDDC